MCDIHQEMTHLDNCLRNIHNNYYSSPLYAIKVLLFLFAVISIRIRFKHAMHVACVEAGCTTVCMLHVDACACLDMCAYMSTHISYYPCILSVMHMYCMC